MANIDFPRGLWPIRHLTGGEVRSVGYTLTTGQTVFQGDVVQLVAGGTVEESDAADGVLAMGVAAEYVTDSDSDGGKEIQIYDDPNIVFGIQQQSGGSIAATEVGANADHVAGTGDSTSKLSGHELNLTVDGTGDQFRVMGLVDEPLNAYGEHANVEVIFNEHGHKGAGNAGV